MKIKMYILLATVYISCNGANTIIFEENFEGDTLDLSFWNYDLGDGCPDLCGWGNDEKQLYTQNNVRLKDGYLTITASKKDNTFYSGRITTKKKVEFRYGTVEVRAKLATGKGIWPAIWALGANIDTVGWPACGEIDIMEYKGKEPGVLHTSLHTNSSHGNTINTKKINIKNIENDFHTYTTQWTPESISFLIDENLVYTYHPLDKNENTWPYDKPFYLLLNLAVGGSFGGTTIDDTIFPSEFIIDYIKVYKH